MKTLYMLIGPKGAGKTRMGTLIAQETDICRKAKTEMQRAKDMKVKDREELLRT